MRLEDHGKVGPGLMAIVYGSGNAATLAFNEVITPHAADFGMTAVQLGTVAQPASAARFPRSRAASS